MAAGTDAGPTHSRHGPTTALTTQALVLGGDGTLLLTLGLLAQAVVIIRVPVVSAHRPVGSVTDDTVAGAVGAALAGQAHSVEPARVWALVWGDKEVREVRVPRQPPNRCVHRIHGHPRLQERVGTGRARGHTDGWAGLPQGLLTLRLALA